MPPCSQHLSRCWVEGKGRGARQWQLSQVDALLTAPQRAPSGATIYSLQQFLLSGVLSLVPLSPIGSWISGLPILPQAPRPSDTSTYLMVLLSD